MTRYSDPRSTNVQRAEAARALAHGRCPHCGDPLAHATDRRCPACRARADRLAAATRPPSPRPEVAAR